MAGKIQVYEIIHTSPEYKTVGDYVSAFGSPVSGFTHKESDFLNIKDANGISNKERIFNNYTPAEKIKYKDKPAKDILLKLGTKLVVPVQNVERNTLLTQGVEVVSNDVVAFKAKALADLEKEPGYVQVYKPVNGKLSAGITKESYPDVTVWIWCRGLSERKGVQNSGTYKMEGEIFDLTPFVSKLTTNVTKNGGNFQLTLPPLVCSLNENGKWEIKKKSLQFYSNPKNLSLSDQGYVAEASLYDESMNRNTFLFHQMIGTNDLIFIRFETLKMEAEDRFKDKGNLNVNKKNLPGKIYDMIGLTDANGISIVPANNDVTINVRGRDLSKLFIEDGTYFYAVEMSEGKLNFAGGSTQKNSLMQRVFSDNALMYFTLWYNNSIENVFKFVIQQLSTIKVVPDELFIDYGKNRNTRFEEANDVFKNKPINDQLNNYQKACKNAIKTLRKENGLTDSTREDAKVTELFSSLQKFFQEIRTKNVRRVSNNITDGWNSLQWTNPSGLLENVEENSIPKYFDGRLFNFKNYVDISSSISFKNLLSNLDSFLDVENSRPKNEKTFKEKISNGIWQIIKLVIDRAISNRRIVDSSASSANGSLMNFFRKVCQEPFVEYYMDTYGDTFNLIARKPPTDQVGLISLLEGKINTEDGRIVSGTPAVIDVHPEDVLNEKLDFTDSNVVSWYHLTPRYNYLGDDSTFSYMYLPALFFEEYADIWGSKPMDISHNYMPYIPLDAQNDKVLDVSEKQAIYDLKYMVESNQYNPFVRSGVLVLNGDRRLKVGNLIRYKPTGEIFIIDAVQQNFSIGNENIDRTTTIHVSRGMVEQLIYGIPVTGSNVDQERDHISYFNIINTKVNLNYIDTEEVIVESVKVGERTIQPVNKELNSNISSDVLLFNENQGVSKLDKYQPEQKKKFIQLINGINQLGYSVVITDTVRTAAQQAVYFNKDKRNAPVGTSKHEIGDAIDINVISSNGIHLKKNSPVSAWHSTGVPNLAKSLGFIWGGEAFSGYYDPVHFQVSKNNTATTTEDIYETRKRVVKGNFLDRSAIFSNFKVNHHVFNFFLRNEQFNKIFNKEAVVKQVFNSDAATELGYGVVITGKRKN